MSDTISLGLWIKRRRKALDLTQDELAQRVGCSLETIRKIEADARRPSREIAARLAAELELPDDERGAFVRAARAELAADRLPPPAQSVARGAFVLAPAPTGAEDAEQPGGAHPIYRFTNLPVQLTPLVGRADAVRALCAQLRGPDMRLVTLTGPGGVGKTRLALQVAEELVDDFADGAYVVDLAPIRDSERVAGAIAQTLGVREIGGQPLTERLQEHLTGRYMLLLLDNFEQVIDAAPLVSKLLTTARYLKVLVTSRENLNLRGEYEQVVQPLALPDAGNLPALNELAQYPAVALFVQRARATQPSFQLSQANAAAVAEICARLDGLPLAIELAAARVKLFPPETLLARLSRRLALLTGGPRDLPARQQTMRSTIAWSYGLLSDDDQRLFRRLGVFVGGCTLEAAEAVLRTEGLEQSDKASDAAPRPQHSVLEGMAALADKSLVRQTADADKPRFRMLETIREYALEQLEASGEADQLRQQHGTYYLEYGWEDKDEEEGAWERRMQHEYDNLRSALDWSLTGGDSETALRLTITLVPLWFERGVRGEAIAALQNALDHPRGVGRTRAQARVRERLATLLGLTGDYHGSQEQYELSLELARELEDWWLTAWDLSRLGWLAREQGDAVNAWPWLSEGIALHRRHDDPGGAAWGLTTLAEVAILEEDPARAEALLAESRAISPFGGGSLWLGWTLNHLGHAAQLRGDFDRAAELHEETLNIFRALSEQHFGLPWVYHSYGETELGRGRLGEAQRWFRQGVVISQRLSDRASIAWCLAGLGTAAAFDEEPERAVMLWSAAERLRLAIGCRPAPAARAAYERALAIVRAQLSDEAFTASRAAGQALALEQAIAAALEVET